MKYDELLKAIPLYPTERLKLILSNIERLKKGKLKLPFSPEQCEEVITLCDKIINDRKKVK